MEYLQTTVKPQIMSAMEASQGFQVLCMYSEDLPAENGEVTLPAYPGEGHDIHVFQYDARRLEEYIHPRKFTNGFYDSFADGNLF